MNNSEIILKIIREQNQAKNQNFITFSNLDMITQLEKNLIKMVRNLRPKYVIEEPLLRSSKVEFKKMFVDRKKSASK